MPSAKTQSRQTPVGMLHPAPRPVRSTGPGLCAARSSGSRVVERPSLRAKKGADDIRNTYDTQRELHAACVARATVYGMRCRFRSSLRKNTETPDIVAPAIGAT